MAATKRKASSGPTSAVKPAPTPSRRSARGGRTKAEESYPTPQTPASNKKPKIEPVEDDREASPCLSKPGLSNPSTAKTEEDETKVDVKRSPSALAKIKKLGDQNQTPFPDFVHPTPEECRRVCEALETVHGKFERPTELVDNDKFGANCGSVPDVLDALIRTILSQNTTNQNSFRAKKGLDETFGRGNYEAIRQASLEKVAESINHGGLANVKSRAIKKVLDQTYEQYGVLSLDHLHQKTDEEAMEELVSFDGVGPKTASCVLLFCLGRESFAVDTHVFRITKSLGWIPAKADRETAFRHLNVRITKELKYALHSLLVKHGRGCENCSATGKTDARQAFEGNCPIKPFMKGRPKPKDVEEEGIEGEEGDVVIDQDHTPAKRKGKGKKKSAKKQKKTVKQAEEEAEKEMMHGLEVAKADEPTSMVKDEEEVGVQKATST